MKRLLTRSVVLGALLLSGAVLWRGQAQAVEEAVYTVRIQDGDFELRDYAASVQAEVTVAGTREEAANRAFNALFRYISGANRSQQQIAMTAPVGQSEKIPMTAPVGQSPAGQGWVVSFMLPASYRLETAPEPTDPQVKLRSLPPRRMASVRYAGGDDTATYQRQLAALQEWLQRRGLESTGELVWARYNAPFTPPLWRRNEILLGVTR